jgi:hypothetical protein
MDLKIVAELLCLVGATIALTLLVDRALARRRAAKAQRQASTTESESAEPLETPKREVPTFITLGSPKEDVLAVLGTPDNVTYKTWFYPNGWVEMCDGKVEHVHAHSHESTMRFRIDPRSL